MKKLLFLWVSFWLLAIVPAFAQNPPTPNIGLSRPEFIAGTWGEDFDNNWLKLDSLFPGGSVNAGVPRVTASTLPTSPTANQLVVVTDAINSVTCTTGGGTSQNLCQWTGSVWVVVGGGSGGGSSAFGSLTSGTNTGQTFILGNGSTMSATGSGAITATAVPFTGVTGTASDAQIPDLNTLSTGLTASKCVRTDGASLLVSDAGDCLSTATLQAGTPLYCTAANASDTYTCSVTPALTAYTTGQSLVFRSTVTPNTGTATLNVNGLGAITITRADGTALQNNDIVVNTFYHFYYDGTNFRLPPLTAGVAVADLQAGTPLYCTASNGTDTYTCSMTPALTAYTTGMAFPFRSTVTANTGTATLNINGLGPITITRADGTTLLNNDIVVGTFYTLYYDGINFRLPSITGAGGGQPADNDLTAIANFAGTGIAVRTGTDAWAQRQIASADTNNLTVTNPGGVAGDPTLAVGPNVALTTRGFTATAGDWNLGSAASFAFPGAPGAAPTTSRRCAYDDTANRLKCGFNGATVTLAITSEIQPLNANLTALAALTGSAAALPYFTGVGAMASASTLLCSDTGGQHLNITSVSPLTFSCGTSSTGGLSGLTPGKLTKALTGSSIGDSIASESGGVITVGGGLVVGSSPFLIFDTSAIAASDKIWTILNFSGTMRPSTGAITAGHNITVDANGLLVDNGVAGSGTWTDSSTSTGTNKTLNAESAGNVFTTVTPIMMDFAACPDGVTPGLLWDADATGDAQPTAACNDTGTLQRPTANFSGSARNSVVRTIRLPKGWTGNVDFKLRYISVGSGGGNVQWDIQTVCRAVGETWDAAYNAAQTITDAVVADNTLNDATQTALTTTGCAAEEDMTIKVSRDGAGDSNNQLAKALYAWVTLRWAVQAQ